MRNSEDLELIISAARNRATRIANILRKSGIALLDIKTMRMEDIVKIPGIGSSYLTDVITIKELMWKEELTNEKNS